MFYPPDRIEKNHLFYKIKSPNDKKFGIMEPQNLLFPTTKYYVEYTKWIRDFKKWSGKNYELLVNSFGHNTNHQQRFYYIL